MQPFFSPVLIAFAFIFFWLTGSLQLLSYLLGRKESGGFETRPDGRFDVGTGFKPAHWSFPYNQTSLFGSMGIPVQVRNDACLPPAILSHRIS